MRVKLEFRLSNSSNLHTNIASLITNKDNVFSAVINLTYYDLSNVDGAPC